MHFDSIDDVRVKRELVESVVRQNPDGVFLTGDVSTSTDLIECLSFLEEGLKRPIYYCCGNHDFYYSSIEDLNKKLNDLSKISPYLKHVSSVSHFPITQTSAVVGHEGWYDGLHGDAMGSRFKLNDWQTIHDFRQVGGFSNHGAVVSLSRKLAHGACTHVAAGIKAAVRSHKHVIVVTHVPPFVSACRHGPNPSDADALPWYSSKMMGDTLLAAARAYPRVSFTVLCGHTHTESRVVVEKNLTCHVAGSEYGRPTLQKLVEVP